MNMKNTVLDDHSIFIHILWIVNYLTLEKHCVRWYAEGSNSFQIKTNYFKNEVLN